MLAAIPSAAVLGIDGHVVIVEAHVSAGLPAYDLVGLPDAAGRESRQRVRAAILSSKLEWPMRRITINLAPAVLRKAGTGLEAAIACGVLLASGQLPPECLNRTAVLGELGLDGTLRPIPGTLVLVDALNRAGHQRVIVPVASAREASLVHGIEILPANTLAEVCAALRGEWFWADIPPQAEGTHQTPIALDDALDLGEVRGLPMARHALTACAAGGHHLLLVGEPGAGKTMLARRLPSILPPLTHDHALEVTRVHSAAGHLATGSLMTTQPFRAPHHGASAAALIGGGSNGRARLGEITLAHRGTLFLDELGEFNPTVLDALRQPLEDHSVRVCRSGISVELPSDFVLVACCNPCPCGLSEAMCRCSDVQRQRYKRRLSAPLLDRFDLRILVESPSASDERGECSEIVRKHIESVLEVQRHRFDGTHLRRNADIPQRLLEHYAPLTHSADATLRDIADLRALSGRGVARIWRVARTLADLDKVDVIDAAHIELASAMREEIV